MSKPDTGTLHATLFVDCGRREGAGRCLGLRRTCFGAALTHLTSPSAPIHRRTSSTLIPCWTAICPSASVNKINTSRITSKASYITLKTHSTGGHRRVAHSNLDLQPILDPCATTSKLTHKTSPSKPLHRRTPTWHTSTSICSPSWTAASSAETSSTCASPSTTLTREFRVLFSTFSPVPLL